MLEDQNGPLGEGANEFCTRLNINAYSIPIVERSRRVSPKELGECHHGNYEHKISD
jgi:hypothetical protein